MSLHKIRDVESLHRHLYSALQLEHATIPPYLSALYSIKPGTNAEATHALRVVAVEEMLHLTLVGNLLNAVGGTPDLTQAGFVPAYPSYLPDGELDFTVNCERFSKNAIETFLKIERPADLYDGREVTLSKQPRDVVILAAHPNHKEAPQEHFFSIGQFYQAIEEGLRHLHKEMGDALFSGDPAHQISSEYYYSGGGKLISITNLETALAALDLIAEQGEGIAGNIFDEDGELSHYFRFHQLVAGRFYQKGDNPHEPSGAPLEVNWEEVFPIKTNAKLADYSENTALAQQAMGFNNAYADFLDLLTKAFAGEPHLFTDAVGDMFRLKEMFYQLMRQPLTASGGVNAAPTFEVDELFKSREKK